MGGGWDASAEAWIRSQGEAGDAGRRFVLDGPMHRRVALARPTSILDGGWGEGRSCRALAAKRYAVREIDPTATPIAQARRRDPSTDYRVGRVETLPYPSGSFDLIVASRS